MTKQEQIEEMSDVRRDTAKEFATRICEMLWNLGIDKDGNRFSYGDLTSENVLYVAKQFGVDIDDRLCKENKIATSHINKLVEQANEIDGLKAENKQLKTECALLDDELRIARQDTIDVLNRLKDYVNQLACDEYGDSACDTNYVTIDIDKYEQDIDEMIAEVQNAEN